MSDEVASESELTPAIGKVARRELATYGVRTYADLTVVTSRELLAIHGVGPKAIRILDDELRRRGLSFRTS